MVGRLRRWLAGVLATLLLAGCSGALLESKGQDGRVERVKIDGTESWDSYDDRPRYPSSKKKSQDDLGIMLKRELTF
jgi:hypothetical protein